MVKVSDDSLFSLKIPNSNKVSPSALVKCELGTIIYLSIYLSTKSFRFVYQFIQVDVKLNTTLPKQHGKAFELINSRGHEESLPHTRRISEHAWVYPRASQHTIMQNEDFELFNYDGEWNIEINSTCNLITNCI